MKKKRPSPDQTDQKLSPENRFPIIGIGASAGGLAAFEAFFSALPKDRDLDMAFVLVQHLAPDHKSILADLITRYTQMPVYEVEDGMEVQPNCTYIIPPNKDMAFLNGVLYLMEPAAPRGLRLPIDFFFRSLAQDQHERAICIVLSGTGSDGTLGLRDIKGEGGMAMVQNPDPIEYGGMPRSAIATGLVDYVLEPAAMPDQLIAYVEHAFGRRRPPVVSDSHQADNVLKKVIIQLRNQTGHDFSGYKSNTINRRVERRMAVNQIDTLEGYNLYLAQNPAEVDALYHDMLIGVTSFFRDPDAYRVLVEKAIPRLFTGRSPETAIRIWVPGCSTGEEAYSIAILLQEHMETLQRNYQVQIFATDIDSRAIEVARAGVYSGSIAADVTSPRLEKFFAPAPDGSFYRIQKSIRDMLVFSEQSVIKDPPFSRMDLISCRNLLIYMGAELQKKIIPLFHYALNPGGLLFLGTSETVGDFIDLFGAVDRQGKLYQRQPGVAGSKKPDLGTFIPPLTAAGVVHKRPLKAGEIREPIREMVERELLQSFAPASVAVNERGEILYVHGHTGKYLELSPGDMGVNLISMARQGLQRELVTALHQAVAHQLPVHNPALKVQTNGDYVAVNLTVTPLTAGCGQEEAATVYLVIFEPTSLAEPGFLPLQADLDPSPDIDSRIASLQKELRAKEEYLHSTLEEMQTTNEEFKSTNEELQSVNEELQSTNEELETSKEELQSINEELTTVNNELQQKVMDLSLINNDMNNLLAGTGVGTLFVDHGLLIQRFTPAITPVINLIPTDVGRPVGHIVANLVGYDRLVEDVRAVLNNLIPREVEVQTRLGAWYLLRIMPYRTLENVIEGAVIIFIDITDMKRTEDLLREAENERQILLETTTRGVIFQDRNGRVVNANPNAEIIMGLSLQEMQAGADILSIWSANAATDANLANESNPVAVAFDTGQAVQDVVISIKSPRKESPQWLRVNAVPQFKPGEDSAYQVYITFEDISDQWPITKAEEPPREET